MDKQISTCSRSYVTNMVKNVARRIGIDRTYADVPRFYPHYVALNGRARTGPIGCTFELTYRCNLMCVMCPQANYRRTNLNGSQIFRSPLSGSKDELTAQELRDAITDLSQSGTKTVTFSGGEPFLRNDTCELIAHCKSLQMRAPVISNGTLVNSALANQILESGLDELSISLDGPEQLNDQIRGKVGAFAATCEGIRNVISERARRGRKGPHVALSVTVNTKNQETYEKIVEIAAQLGVDAVIFGHIFASSPSTITKTERLLEPWGFNGDVKPENPNIPESLYHISISDVVARLNRAMALGSQLGITVKVAPNLSEAELHQRLESRPKAPVNRCFYPWLNMRVDPFGNVYPCSVDVRLGSLRSSSARDVWNGEEYRSFRKALKKADLFPMCARCCALGNRLWNKLPNLSISLPSLKGAAIRPGEHAVSDLVPTRTREPLNNYCQ